MKKINAIKTYQLKNGQTRYKFSIRVDKKHVTTRNGFYSYNDASLAYFNLKQEIIQNTYKHSHSKYTYEDIYDEWIKNYKLTVRDTTLYQTQALFKNYILPSFKNCLISNITFKDCQKAVNEWSTQITTYKPLVTRSRVIFNEAIKFGYIKSNPMMLVTLPRENPAATIRGSSKATDNFYSLDELKRFLSEARKEGLYKYVIFRTLAFSGMRIGELLGLKWSDINFKTNYISVSKTLILSPADKKYELHATKNNQSRLLIMDKETMEVLSAWKTYQADHNHKKTNNYNFVFESSSDKGNNIVWTRGSINAWQIHINGQVDIRRKITLHGFRHTHATLLYDMNPNITPKDVQKRLGHSNYNITMNIYEHATDRSDNKVQSALNNLNQ